LGLVCLHAKEEIEAFARRNPLLHLYEIGDLDDFFWPQTVWYALEDGGAVRQLALLYTAMSIPVLLANTEQPPASMQELMRLLLPLLPGRFYAHLGPEALAVLADVYHAQPYGTHCKMGLADPSRLAQVDTSGVVRLSPADEADLEALYRCSYPGNWFVPRMLQTGCYYGVRRGAELVCAAGVHVYSARYRVAALGNITTHPGLRGRGLATAASARLCQELLQAGVASIGLNVKADNAAALSCYRKLGFERVAEYGEYTLERKRF
jgi:GNAT superfamily N-acetyltransferase